MAPTAPTAVVCLTGSELTRGETRDINGSFLATELTELGVEVLELRLLPDESSRLEDTFRSSVASFDLVLISGGLGPTADDLTVAALAAAVGRGVRQDDDSKERMRRVVLERGRKESEIPDNFYKQSEVVEGSKVIANPRGLAPGCLVETDRGFAVTMPGVPSELRAMFREGVVSEIEARFTLSRPRIGRLKLLGQPESWAEARIQSLGIDLARLEYGISAKPGELTLKFVARDPADHDAVGDAIERVEAEFGEDVARLPDGVTEHGKVGDEIAFTRIVHEKLLAAEVTVATAESCTGGMIAKRLTDCAGSSDYFLGAIVAYQDEVKVAQLGVSQSDLAKHGAVSEPVCRQMALGARRVFGSDYAISTTGIAGPGGERPGKPVGTVWIGLACPPQTGASEPRVLAEKKHFRLGRDAVRGQTALRAMDLLRREI